MHRNQVEQEAESKGDRQEAEEPGLRQRTDPQPRDR